MPRQVEVEVVHRRRVQAAQAALAFERRAIERPETLHRHALLPARDPVADLRQQRRQVRSAGLQVGIEVRRGDQVEQMEGHRQRRARRIAVMHRRHRNTLRAQAAQQFRFDRHVVIRLRAVLDAQEIGPRPACGPEGEMVALAGRGRQPPRGTAKLVFQFPRQRQHQLPRRTPRRSAHRAVQRGRTVALPVVDAGAAAHLRRRGRRVRRS